MSPIYKTAEGERLVRARYLAFLKYWPVPNEHVRITTSQGASLNFDFFMVLAPW